MFLFRKTSVFLKKATQRMRSKKKKKKHWGVCVCVRVCFIFVALRALPAPSLAHSVAYPWLLGGNINLKQNLSFIKVGKKVFFFAPRVFLLRVFFVLRFFSPV